MSKAPMNSHRKRLARRQLVRMYGPFCTRCGRGGDLTLDHVVPVSLGGAHAVRNLQLLCSDCNAAKSNHTDAAPGWAA